MKNRQEKSPVSEFLAEHETGLGIESLSYKLQRYAGGKNRALDMAKYITNFHTGKGNAHRPTCEQSENKRLVAELESCASYLVFKNYYTINEVRLHAMKSCRKHLLCPFCAMRRGAKYLQAYLDRLAVVTAQNPRLRAYFVTVTIKNTESLEQGYTHLRNAMRKMMKQRSNALRGQKQVEFAKALGAVHSIEFKRGSGSGLWHPHAHMIWLCEIPPDAHKLSQEWLSLTGDSYIVDVRECYGETLVDAFMEVFKYALKFTALPFADNWLAYQTLKGKRLIDSFGCLKGVEVPEKLTDDDLDEPYLLMLYRFIKGAGYSFVGQGTFEEIVQANSKMK